MNVKDYFCEKIKNFFKRKIPGKKGFFVIPSVNRPLEKRGKPSCNMMVSQEGDRHL